MVIHEWKMKEVKKMVFNEEGKEKVGDIMLVSDGDAHMKEWQAKKGRDPIENDTKQPNPVAFASLNCYSYPFPLSSFSCKMHSSKIITPFLIMEIFFLNQIMEINLDIKRFKFFTSNFDQLDGGIIFLEE